MKKLLFTLLIIILNLSLKAQSKEELIEARKIIQHQITNLSIQLDSIEKLITNFDIKELEAKSLKLKCIVSKNTYLSSKPDFSGEKIIDVVENDAVLLIDITESGYLYVAFQDKKGYLLKNEVYNSNELESVFNSKMLFYNTESQKRDSIVIDSIKEQIKIKNAQYIRKYGKELGSLILQKKVKIGMTSEMCVEAWGKPNDINRTTGSWGTHEQWVYDNDCYLYFENGILTTIQN